MFKAPTQLPPVSLLLDDLPTRDTRRVARHLGLSEATIRRYRRDDDAPRLVLLALFFETRWGRSIMDTELEHRHRMHLALIASQRRRIAELEATVGRLLDAGDFGAANDPLFVHGVAPAYGHHQDGHHAPVDLHHHPQLPNAVAVHAGERAGQAVASIGGIV